MDKQVYACESIGLEMGAKGAMCTRENVRILLESDVDALMDVWFDESTKTYRVGELSDEIETTLTEICELFRDYARATYGMPMGDWTDRFVRPEVARYLWDNAKDGLKMSVDRFLRRGQWDGVERIRPLLERVMTDSDVDIFLEWYSAAINRILNPGSEIPFVLVVKAEDRAFAQMMMLWLCGFNRQVTKMWNQTPLAPSSVDFQRITASSTFVKLQNVKDTAENIWKLAVQTKTTRDEIRLPYDRKLRHYPRRCSFYIVTDDEFDASEHPCEWAVRTIEVLNVLDEKSFKHELNEYGAQMAREVIATMLES
jgi:hypothetical protein